MLFAYPRLTDKLQQSISKLYHHYSIPRWMFAAGFLETDKKLQGKN
ncbi:MAG: hypothetical protein JW830_02965 [Bacteroidales bacterium]|nr:hypothetical protein [Bacteroidales bacterium]